MIWVVLKLSVRVVIDQIKLWKEGALCMLRSVHEVKENKVVLRIKKMTSPNSLSG